MKIIKQLLVSAALVSATFGAQAATINLGTLPAGNSDFGNSVLQGSFNDIFNFTLLDISDATLGAGSLNFSLGNVPYLNISNMSLSLFNSSNDLLGSGLDFSVASLTAGNFYLSATGMANGSEGGRYAGVIRVTPVPEAETYAMMLAGLGLMGFIARRRRAE